MKNILLILVMAFSITANAYNEKERTVLNLYTKDADLSALVQNTEIEIMIRYLERLPETALIILQLKKSETKADYFRRITMSARFFIENYKIGKSTSKNVLIASWTDNNFTPEASGVMISVNNLKLLNNRTFGTDDMAQDAKSKVLYPIKEILRRGKIVNYNGCDKCLVENKSLTNEYHAFLNDFQFPGIIESMVENYYKSKKEK